MTLRNFPMVLTLSSSNFFPPVQLLLKSWNFFHLESRIAKADRRLNCVTRGRYSLQCPTRGSSVRKGYHFQGLGIFNNYSSSPNGFGLMGYWLRGHEGERNICFSKVQLVGQKYRDKTTLGSKTRFYSHCFGFQSRRFSLLVGYNR